MKDKLKFFFKKDSFKRLQIMKNTIENGSKTRKIVLYICLIFFFFSFIVYSLVFMLRLCIGLKSFFLIIFPHFAMKESMFYENYGINLNELTFFQKVGYWWLEFINPTDIPFKIAFILIIFLLIYALTFNVVKKIINRVIKKKEKFFLISNTDITMNLLFYHFVGTKLMEKLKDDENFSSEDFHQTKNYIVENSIELYWIVENNLADDLLPIIIRYKNHLTKDLKENPNIMRQFVYDKMEKNHLIDLINFLEDKKNNDEKMPLVFDDFVIEFSKIKIHDNIEQKIK